MKTFKISIGRGLELDVLKLVETRVGICSNSGGGKSHLMRLIAEKIDGRIPIHIIDWEGEWYTLRSKVDAVLVAKNGDLVPQVHTAAKLAQRLLDNRVSAILDLSSMKRQDRLLFAASYIEALLDAPLKTRHPALVFIDEVHRLAPEVVSKGGGKELLSAIHRARAAVIALMDSGRKRALGGVLATQRLSKVSKDAIGEANNIFIGRYAQDTDLKRVGDLLGLDVRAREAPKTFNPGDFFAQGPALSKPGTVKFKGFDTTTKAPKFGATPKAAAPSKTMTKILADLATIPEEVELEAKNFKEAQAQLKKAQAEIKRLEKENRLARDGKMSAAEKGRIIHEALEAMMPDLEKNIDVALAEERKKWLGFVQPLDKQLTAMITETEQLAADFTEFKEAIESTVEPSKAPPRGTKKRQSKKNGRWESFPGGIQKRVLFPPASDFGRDMTPREVDELVKEHASGSKARLTHDALPFSWKSAPGKVLTVLIQHYPESLGHRRLASLAGVSPKSSTYRNAVSKLRVENLIENAGQQTLRAHPAAHAAHAEFLPSLPSGDQLIAQWQQRLGSGVPRKLFDALVAAGGIKERDLLSVAIGVPWGSSTFRNAVSKLRTLGLVEPGYPITAAPHVLEAIG